MSLTVGSLFSGIGGLELGLEWAGMGPVVWQAEPEPYCARVLEKHWPGVPNFGDIKEVDWSRVERPDLVCGGFPCQPVSLAGRRRGDADDRWLWPEFARCLRVLRPRYALVENVPGLLVRGMGDVLGDLAALWYDAQWGCIPAAAVGAPHLRWRVFVFAHSECLELWHEPGLGDGPSRSSASESGDDGEAGDVADAERVGVQARYSGFELGQGESCRRGWWESEPDVGRVAHGVPARVDRLRALGNAVVPQVAELVGRMIYNLTCDNLA